MIRDFFAALGENAWQIHCASSADQALEMLKTRKMDLVVSDVNMPMLDGIQFLHILNRRHPGSEKSGDHRQRHGGKTFRLPRRGRRIVHRETAFARRACNPSSSCWRN